MRSAASSVKNACGVSQKKRGKKGNSTVSSGEEKDYQVGAVEDRGKDRRIKAMGGKKKNGLASAEGKRKKNC